MARLGVLPAGLKTMVHRGGEVAFVAGKTEFDAEVHGFVHCAPLALTDRNVGNRPWFLYRSQRNARCADELNSRKDRLGARRRETRVTPLQDAVHLCTDMQRIFAPGGLWQTPWMEQVLPVIVEIAARYAGRTVFTRFITPEHASDRPGQWQGYYRRWQAATRGQLAPGQLDLVPELWKGD